MSRKLTDRERLWRERLDSHVESGMAVAEFCEMVGVSTAALYQWQKRLGRNRNAGRHGSGRHSDSNGDSGTSLFVPVAVRESGGDSIRLELADELMVHVPDDVSEARLVTIFRAALSARESTPC